MFGLSSKGTNTLSTMMSLLPVARIPVVSQTSTIVTFEIGTSITRNSG
jgi:hypothetical protein